MGGEEEEEEEKEKKKEKKEKKKEKEKEKKEKKKTKKKKKERKKEKRRVIACTEPQCLYRGGLYLTFTFTGYVCTCPTPHFYSSLILLYSCNYGEV